VSWRDRDWARFTNEERRQFYGDSGYRSSFPSIPSQAQRVVFWCLILVAAGAVAGYAYTSRSDRVSPGQASPTLPSVIYGGQMAYAGSGDPYENAQQACTSEAANTRLGVWVCVTWTIIQPGQTARPAIDPGGQCGVRHVDQTTGTWFCDRVTPPDPDSLPTPSVTQPRPGSSA
jgi:hypothetical protein